MQTQTDSASRAPQVQEGRRGPETSVVRCVWEQLLGRPQACGSLGSVPLLLFLGLTPTVG